MSQSQSLQLNTLIQVRATDNLTSALDRAAAQRLTSRAAYIRQAMIDRLQRDGIEIGERGAA